MKGILLACLVVLVSTTTLAQKNVFKLGVPAFAMGGAVVQYERDLIPLINLQVGVGIYGNKEVNPMGLFAAMDDLGISASGMAFQAEVRIYPNIAKEGPKGFYIAPYAKLGNYNLSYAPTLNTSINVNNVAVDAEIAASLEGDLGMQAVGLQLGHQWLIASKVCINLYMFGPGVSFYNVSFDGSVDFGAAANGDMEDLETALEDVIKEKLQDVPFVGNKIADAVDIELAASATAGGNPSVSIQDMVLPMLPRMRMGLSVGIAL